MAAHAKLEKGQVFGQLTIMGVTTDQNVSGCYLYDYKCTCGEVGKVSRHL